jgi:membrane-associated HD superfamily phosphohydrolase
MAITRKMLKAMGIEEEKIEQIIEAHTETVDALKEKAEENAEAAKNLGKVQKELDDAKKDLEAMKNDSFKEKYDNVKKEFDDFKKEIAGKEAHEKKVKAYKEMLKDANLSEKGIEKAVKYAEWDKIEVGDDEKIKDAPNHIKTVKEEWAEYVVTTQQKGANPSNPPAGGGNGGTGKTKAEIMAIKDPAERQSEMLKNAEMFGI